MRKLVTMLGLAAALGACSKSAPDPRGVASDEVLVQVSASGRADSRPDEARFTVGVDTIAATSREASARNGATINRVAAALQGLGVKEDDLQTRSITLSRIDYGPNRGRFQANNLIDIKVRDIKRAGEALAAITEAGANVLSGPNLRVSDPENAGRSAYAAAYRSARGRAEAYAQAAGLKVTRVLTITDSGIASPYRHYDSDAAMTEQAAPPPVAATAAPPVQPGISTREVQIRVDFALSK
ncbi:MAG TPA: SIMPL domain-containing protein [Allosphingosinicella sp.]|nr:SIMPL domain-containing protein [Allosphingosinicella sp.]